MIRFLTLLLVAATLAPVEPEAQQLPRASWLANWENSIVTIEVASTQYDYNQPWSRRTRRLRKTGVVVGERQILTTADQLADQTLIRLQKQGRGQWFIGALQWVDYPANLALITADDTGFWAGLKPANLGGAIPDSGYLQILRWREGNFENRRAEFTQYSVRESQLSPVQMAVLEASSDIQGAGWGEPIVSDSQVAGLLSAQNGRNCIAIPAQFIKSVLDARQKERFEGIGFFHFYWQSAENTESLKALGLEGPPRGVIVHHVPERPDGAKNVMKTNDIILNIDGFELDVQGDYIDPDFGHLNIENLAVRNKWAGDEVRMRICREGKEMDIRYELPRYAYTNSLLAFATPDQPPEYLVVGGLIFQPLDLPFLQAWGGEWKRRAPFRLYYYNSQAPTKDRKSLVIMSQVLPDPYNIGYQELKYLVVDKVNDKPVAQLEDLREALKHPLDGYHVIDFVKSDGLRRIVVAAGEEEANATDRVLKRYGIVKPFFLTETHQQSN